MLNGKTAECDDGILDTLLLVQARDMSVVVHEIRADIAG
jgi:hypothetical protein